MYCNELDDAASKLLSAVLVVDDDIIIQKIHQKLLTKLGAKTILAVGNGKEAVDIHLQGHSFDLILMDVDMPIMNGIEATKKLRAMGVHSMIAGVSTRSGEAAEVQEFKDAGLDEYQEKPLTIAKLTSILNNLILLHHSIN